MRRVSSSSNKKYKCEQPKEPVNNILAQFLASLNLGRASTFPPLTHSVEEKGLSDRDRNQRAAKEATQCVMGNEPATSFTATKD